MKKQEAIERLEALNLPTDAEAWPNGFPSEKALDRVQALRDVNEARDAMLAEDVGDAIAVGKAAQAADVDLDLAVIEFTDRGESVVVEQEGKFYMMLPLGDEVPVFDLRCHGQRIPVPLDHFHAKGVLGFINEGLTKINDRSCGKGKLYAERYTAAVGTLTKHILGTVNIQKRYTALERERFEVMRAVIEDREPDAMKNLEAAKVDAFLEERINALQPAKRDELTAIAKSRIDERKAAAEAEAKRKAAAVRDLGASLFSAEGGDDQAQAS